MSIRLIAQGLVELFACETTILNTLAFHLYVNDHVPVVGDTLANYTECTDTGYASVVLGDFAAPFLNSSNEVEWDAPNYTFTFNHVPGDFTIYGFYATNPATGHIVMAERAASPFTVTAPGQTYTWVPKILGGQLA